MIISFSFLKIKIFLHIQHIFLTNNYLSCHVPTSVTQTSWNRPRFFVFFLPQYSSSCSTPSDYISLVTLRVGAQNLYFQLVWLGSNERTLFSLRNPKKFRTFEPFKFSNARFFHPYKQRKNFRTRSSLVR